MTQSELIKKAYAFGASVALQQLGYDTPTAEAASVKLAADEGGMNPLLKALIGLGGGAALGAGAGALAGKLTGKNLSRALLDKALFTKSLKNQPGLASALEKGVAGVPGASTSPELSTLQKKLMLPKSWSERHLMQNPILGSGNLGLRGGALLGTVGGLSD